MPRIHLQLEQKVERTFRVDQVAGLFDVPVADKSRLELSVHVPAVDADWQIGVIAGPSGSGKSQVARQWLGGKFIEPHMIHWPDDAAVVDGFADDLDMQAIPGVLTSVGFSSPPSWVLPYRCLSTGQRMRCDLARVLLAGDEPVIGFDEFTSVVDRDVAKAMSVAVSKTVRKGRVPVKRFVAVTCHYDVIDWLEPDWVLDMADRRLVVGSKMKLADVPRGRLRRRKPWTRPAIGVEVRQAKRGRTWLWPLFKPHHYLSAALHPSARCYAALWDGRPVGFIATLPNAGHKGRRMVHRFVTLPDYQGMGIGMRFLDQVADLESTTHIVSIRTSHPAIITSLRTGGRDGRWYVPRGGVDALGGLHKGFSAIGSRGRTVVTFVRRRGSP